MPDPVEGAKEVANKAQGFIRQHWWTAGKLAIGGACLVAAGTLFASYAAAAAPVVAEGVTLTKASIGLGDVFSSAVAATTGGGAQVPLDISNLGTAIGNSLEWCREVAINTLGGPTTATQAPTALLPANPPAC